jgi:hypothetical protein
MEQVLSGIVCFSLQGLCSRPQRQESRTPNWRAVFIMSCGAIFMVAAPIAAVRASRHIGWRGGAAISAVDHALCSHHVERRRNSAAYPR